MLQGDELAQKQLHKWGWTEGKGLGAKEDGISDPLKASLKFDKHGLGHDVVKDIAFNWWDGVFNKALDTVGKSNQEIEVLEKKEKEKKKSYGNFVKKRTRTLSSETGDTAKSNINTLSKEMVNECEGRTAHKGARHGVYSSGKLERIAKAEKDFLNSSSYKQTKTERLKRKDRTSRTEKAGSEKVKRTK